MKKLLGILVLGLLWCNVGVAGSRIEKLPQDVVSGDKFSKANNKYNTYKKYGMQVVDKKDGHPVRAGNKSIRFEVRAGDCGQSNDFDDCADKKERHELAGTKTISGGTWWHAWSIYFPKDFINVYPTRVYIGQFYAEAPKYGDSVNPPWMFDNNKPGYWINNMVRVPGGHQTQLLTREQMLGKWNDILINVKWTHKDNGYLKLWVNNELSFDYKGPTKRKYDVFFKFGIYRAYVWKKKPPQIVYFDEVRVGKTKEKVVGNLPPLQ